MAFSLIDIGVNLTAKVFGDDQSEVITRAKNAGINHLVLIGSNIEDSKQAIELAKKYPHCRTTVGIHPHHAKDFNNDSIDELTTLASLPQCCVLGEMGLDFNRNYSPPKQQLVAFEKQLELAAELKQPIYLHQRDAHQYFLAMIKDYRDHISEAVIHCFTGDKNELYDYLDLDLHFGITGWICDDRRGTHLLKLLKDIPLTRLMLETDAPYLLPRNLEKTFNPQPRSRRNEPLYLLKVLQTTAKAIDITEQELAKKTTATAKEFFGF